MEPGGEANPAPHPTDDEELALPPQPRPLPPAWLHPHHWVTASTSQRTVLNHSEERDRLPHSSILPTPSSEHCLA